jgi:hypothetical protein
VGVVSEQDHQLRIAFTAAQAPSHVVIDLAGLTVSLSSDLPDHDLFAFLREHDLAPMFTEHVGVSIAAVSLPKLVELVEFVTGPPSAATLLQALEFRPAEGSPATLTVERNCLLLSWDGGGVAFDEYLDDECAAAFIASDIAFVASDDAWDRLERVSRAPSIVARCAVNGDGFVEINALRPQMVEQAEVPGMFKLGPTTFAASLHVAPQLVKLPGFVWNSRRPPVRPTPAIALPGHLSFAEHIVEDLPSFLVDLDLTGARVVRWDSGLGRRMFALAALEALDAFPAAVLASPSALWVWRRDADLIGRSIALTHDRADLSLVTYHDVRHRRFDVQALVFDDPTSDEANAARPFLRALAHLRDTLKIALCSTAEWPDTLEEQVTLLELLRPREFSSNVALAERYPLDPQRRCAEHVECYVDARTWGHTGAMLPFKRSTTHVVHLSVEQEQALAAAGPRLAARPAHEELAEVLETVTAGPSHAVSPKLAVALSALRAAKDAGKSIVVATRHQRAVSLLRALARPLEVEVVSKSSPSTSCAIVKFDTELPDLTRFDEVWFLDYPWSLAELDAAVGPSDSPHGPDVMVVHAAGSIDDRVALLAARRAEAPLGAGAAHPDDTEIAYLLARR